MKQFFHSSIIFFLVLTACSSSFISCQQENSYEENDKYDGADMALQFEIERTRDLSTGKVPWEKLRLAMDQTEQSKNQSSNLISALSWIERGPNGDFSIGGNPRPNMDQTAGRIRAVMVDSLDPTKKTVWAGGVAGGLWKTTDITVAPSNWVLVNDFLANLAVAAICQDPRPGFQNIMYFCTGESFGNADAVRGIGVYKSVDAGATWTFLPSTNTYLNGTRILCDFLGNVYLGTRNTGLLRSTNGGSSWTTITPSGIGTNICDLEISSTSASGRLHVTTGIFSTSGYSYTDIPSTVLSSSGWNAPTTPFTHFNQRIEMAISGNNLIALPCNGSYQVPSVWMSTDGGDNWNVTPGQPATNWGAGQAWYNLSAGINPANPNEFIVGALDCHKTSNGGTSWTKISTWASTTGQYVHADQHDIQWWDGGNKLMFACDGGIHYSSNGGTTIRDRNKNLRLKQFYSIAIHPIRPNYFIGGTQDNGMHRMDHPGLDSSAEVVGGDGCYSAIDQMDGKYQFGSYVYNVYRRSINDGANWSTPINNQSTGRFVNPWDYDNNNFKIYACNNAGTFFRWNDPRTGNSNEVVSVSAFGSGNVSAVHVSPYTANRVYFGTGSGGIIQVENANTGTSLTGTVINSGSGMPVGYLNCIVTGSNDQNLIACFTNYGVQNIWVSTNGGTTWTAIDGNLPDMPVRWALFHPDTDTKAFIATETGVWETDLINGSSTVWNANNTFPNVRTDMIKYRASDRTIAAGTHGRGIWSAVVPGASCTSASITSEPSNATICAGANSSFTVVAGGTGPFGYQWQLSTTGCGGTWNNISNGGIYSGATSASLSVNGATAGTYYYRVIVTGNCAPLTVNSNCATLTVNAATLVNTQPINSIICAAANTSFTVAATGTALTYQWQVSTNGGGSWNNLSNGAPYSNVTTATMTITAVTAGFNGYLYRCILSSACNPVNSSSAMLTVNTAPSISSQPVNVSSCASNSETFSVSATGTGLTYQWQLSTDGGSNYNNLSNGAPYSNVTTATLTINPTTLGMNNYRYRCIVSGTCPSSVTSTGAILTVGSSLSITSQPANSALCAGLNTSFSITTTGTVLSMQWQESINAGVSWNNISNGGIYSGATTATLSLTGVTVGMNNYQYRTVVTGSCSPINSNAAILTVNAAASISAQPINSTICDGNTSIFSVTASGAGLNYQWQISTTGCAGTWTNLSNTAPYSGTTSSTLTITGATTALNGNVYRCNVTGSCAPSVTSNCASLTVNTAVSITTQPSNSIVCATTNTTFTVAASGTTPTYQWQESTNGGSSWNNISNGGIYSGATTVSLTLTGITAGMNNYQYRAVVSGASPCGSSNSNAAVLTVNTAPAIASQPSNVIVCSTTNSACYSVSATGTNITYQWQVNTAGCTGGVWTNLSNAAPYTGVTTATLCITNATTAMNAYGYRCVVNGTCTPNAISNCATLTVNSPVNITSQPSNTTVCAGAQTTFTVGATGTSPTYLWQESTNGGGTWNNVVNGGVYSGATTAILTLTGVTAGMNNYQYRNIVTGATACNSATSSAGILNVNTAAAITTQPVAATTICGGQNTSFNVIANGTALTYQWQVSTDGGTNYSNLSNTAIYSGVTSATLNITSATTGMSTYRYRCVISGTCTPSATSNAALLTVHTPLNVTTQPSAATICATGTISFTMAATGTGPTYQWQESTNGGTSWNNISNGGIYSGATSTTLTLTGVTSGMNGYLYRTTITGTVPCSILNTIAAVLTVSPRPIVSLSAVPYLNLLPNLTTTITASVTPASGYTLAWTRNGSPISIAGNSHLVNVNGMGVYTVVATIGSCTSAPVSITIADSVSNNLYIFPSPNDGRFTVSYYSQGASTSNQTKQKLVIFASEGKQVYNKDLIVNQPYQLHQIDLRRNGMGVYVVVLSDANGKRIKTGKVVVR